MNLENSLEQLKNLLFAIHPLKDNEWEELESIWEVTTAKRKTILTAAGETERYIYFVTGGVQRVFAMHNDKEATLVFMYPYSFAGVADSFLLQTPSRYYFETLTQSQFLRATYSQLNTLLLKHHRIETLIRKSISVVLAGVLERQVEIQSYTAEQKFRTLLTRSPHILQLVPHKYLANYLGLDATTFSKLLSSVRL